MDQYINQEDVNMKQMLDSLIAEETWVAPEESRNNVKNNHKLFTYWFIYWLLIIFNICRCSEVVRIWFIISMRRERDVRN